MKTWLHRSLITTMSLAMLTASSLPVFADEQAAKQEANLDIGILVNGSMLVPLRDITDELNAKLTWNDEQKSITLDRAGSSVFMKIDDPQVQVNGQAKTLEVAPRIEGDKTFVPLRLISEAFGAKVEWNGEKQQATVQTADKSLYIMGYPYFEWEGNHFVYSGDLVNGLPQGQGTAVKGTSIYNDVWYKGAWDQGKPVELLSNDYKIYVNGNYLTSDYPPIVRNDVVYLPLWALLGTLKMSAKPVGDVLRINHPNRVLLIGSDSNLITYFGNSMDQHSNRMEYPVISEQSVLYVPITFLPEYLDVQVAWGEGRRIDLTAGDLTKNTSWGVDNKINKTAEQLQTDIAAESIWKKYGDSLWSSRDLPYPAGQKFNQYEKLTVISYSGLNATLSDGNQSIDFKFSSLSSLGAAFYTKDPLAEFDWSSETKDLIRREKVAIGMTREQVLVSWGKPDNVNAYGGKMEQWVYRYGSSFKAQYLYFSGNILDSIQNP
ncbi:hypothetical protein GCM10023310_24240 [Paenibacillus vulneris]|uniref:Stalk domain-containing protein n=1 Tax=Paenibacillus vulneris TaxID=1133364 RepID=A0ABW3UYN7_9BACL